MALMFSILYFSFEICHALFHILLKALCKRTMRNRNPFLVEWKDISATSIFLSLVCQSQIIRHAEEKLKAQRWHIMISILDNPLAL